MRMAGAGSVQVSFSQQSHQTINEVCEEYDNTWSSDLDGDCDLDFLKNTSARSGCVLLSVKNIFIVNKYKIYKVVILRVSGLSSFISHASGSLDIIFHASGLVPPITPLLYSRLKYLYI